jgi:hypothetical protein
MLSIGLRVVGLIALAVAMSSATTQRPRAAGPTLCMMSSPDGLSRTVRV